MKIHHHIKAGKRSGVEAVKRAETEREDEGQGLGLDIVMKNLDIVQGVDQGIGVEAGLDVETTSHQDIEVEADRKEDIEVVDQEAEVRVKSVALNQGNRQKKENLCLLSQLLELFMKERLPIS